MKNSNPHNPYWRFDALLQIQLSMMKRTELFNYAKNSHYSDQYRYSLLKICNEHYLSCEFAFDFLNSKHAIQKRWIQQKGQARLEWIEDVLTQGLIQTIAAKGMRTVMLFDGNNYFHGPRPIISTKYIAEGMKYIQNWCTSNPNIYPIFVFDNSILRLVDSPKNFRLLYRQYTVTVVDKGIQADRMILDLYDMIHNRYPNFGLLVKVISRDGFVEYRDHYPYDVEDFIQIHGHTEFKKFMQRSVLLDLV